MKNKDLFIKTLMKEKALIERRERQEKERQEQTQKQLAEVKENLKKVYTKKVACYNVYDLKDNEILCNQFNNLDDLTTFILKNMRNLTNKRNIAINYISQGKLLLDRYKIVVDKFNIEDMEEEDKAIKYDNKSYNYDVENIEQLNESIQRKVNILKAI